MNSLSHFDLFLIFSYFVILLYIGYRSSRGQSREDFLIAERKLGTWDTMMTLNASKTGAILMAFVAMMYLFGIASVWYFIGMILGAIIFIPFAIRLKRMSKGKYYTLADYFKYNYGKKTALLASALTIFIMFGFTVVNLMSASKIFVFFTGWSFWLCATLMTMVVLAYLLSGGYKAVAKTDVLQYLAIFFVMLVITFYAARVNLVPQSFGNFFKVESTVLIGFFMAGITMTLAAPGLWQRVYSTKSEKTLKKGMLLSIPVYALVAFLLTILALVAKSNFPDIDPDLALIYSFKGLLPTGLVGLATVLLFAAIMSSLDTYIYAGASAIVQDYMKWNKKNAVRKVRGSIIGLTLLAYLIAVLIGDLIIATYLFVSFSVILAIPVIATWIKKGVSSRALIYSMIFGILSNLLSLAYSLPKGEISPLIAIISIASSTLGLFVGAAVAFVKKKRILTQK